jgi:hypothetical protein
MIDYKDRSSLHPKADFWRLRVVGDGLAGRTVPPGGSSEDMSAAHRSVSPRIDDPTRVVALSAPCISNRQIPRLETDLTLAKSMSPRLLIANFLRFSIHESRAAQRAVPCLTSTISRPLVTCHTRHSSRHF